MARAESMEPAAESGGGGDTYCMLPCPLLAPTWPRPLTSSISMHGHHSNPLDPLQALRLSYPLPYPHPMMSASPAPPRPPPCARRGHGSDGGGGGSPPGRRGALPDLLPPREPPSQMEMQIRRVAEQLRTIGDEFNASHSAPPRQDWRGVCRAVLSFISQTLSALYRLT